MNGLFLRSDVGSVTVLIMDDKIKNTWNTCTWIFASRICASRGGRV